jgi:hypothetical protein
MRMHKEEPQEVKSAGWNYLCYMNAARMYERQGNVMQKEVALAQAREAYKLFTYIKE